MHRKRGGGRSQCARRNTERRKGASGEGINKNREQGVAMTSGRIDRTIRVQKVHMQERE